MKIFRLFVPVILLVVLSPLAAAHDEKEMRTHPATKVTLEYLRHAMSHDWTKAAALLSQESLVDLKNRYIKQHKATKQGEDFAGGAVGDLELGVIEALDPTQFYVRYHRFVGSVSFDPERVEQLKKSLRVKVLGVSEEQLKGKALCHILVRSRYNSGASEIGSLELISLVKNDDGAWQITLATQEPLVTKLTAKD